MSQKVFLNGQIIDNDEAAISISDGGFLYGAGLFETMRCAGGIVFGIDDHIDRLLASCAKLNIAVDFDRKFLHHAVYEAISANAMPDARIRLTVSSGSLGTEKPAPTVLVTVSPFASYPKEYYDKGSRVVLSSCRQNPTDPTAGHKSLSYFPRLMMLDEARKKGALESLWFTFDGRLAEGCISNVFVVKAGKVFTPALATPVLPGVIRKHVLTVASASGIETSESDLYIKDVLAADEVFITNSVMHIMPVVGVESHTIAEGKIGTVTKKLMQDFVEHFQKATT